jgi:hypothetical protein
MRISAPSFMHESLSGWAINELEEKNNCVTFDAKF